MIAEITTTKARKDLKVQCDFRQQSIDIHRIVRKYTLAISPSRG